MQATLKRGYPSDLHWLAFLLTGRGDQTIEVAAETGTIDPIEPTFFESWMNAWSRRVAIAKALTGIRNELAASMRRTSLNRMNTPALLPQEVAIRPGIARSELEAAVLAIDHFPRAVLVLTVFERVPAPDCAVLLDSSPGLIRKALNIALLEVSDNLARAQAWRLETHSSVMPAEIQYA